VNDGGAEDAGTVREMSRARRVHLSFDDDSVEYECTSPDCGMRWADERDPECDRCNEVLSQHLRITADSEASLLCPGVLEDNTFSAVSD